MNKTLIKHIIREILSEMNRFSFKPTSGSSSGRRFVPEFFTLEKSVRDQLKDLIKFYGDKLYVDAKVPIALGYLERGRQSYEKTQNFPSLTKMLQDKLPQNIRISIKKGVEGQKVVNIGGQSMVPLDLEVTKDEMGNYLIKNPYKKDKMDDESAIKEYEAALNEILILEKKNLELVSEKKNDSTVFKFKGILSINLAERNKEEVLSDIRALTGITIVSTKPAQGEKISPSDTESILSIKVDPHPYMGKGQGGLTKDKVKDEIIADIRRITGVEYFKLIGDITLAKL
jgi:hypothetical protein